MRTMARAEHLHRITAEPLAQQLRKTRRRLVPRDPFRALRPGRPVFTFCIAGALLSILWSVYSTPALTAAQIALIKGADAAGGSPIAPVAEAIAGVLPQLSAAGQDVRGASSQPAADAPPPARDGALVALGEGRERRASPVTASPRPSASATPRATPAPGSSNSAPAVARPVVAAPSPSDSPNCRGFDWQETAQLRLEQDRSDPWGLDGPAGAVSAGRSGVACEDLPRRAAQPAPSDSPDRPSPSPTPSTGRPTPSPRATVAALVPPPVAAWASPSATPRPETTATMRAVPTPTPTLTPTAPPVPTPAPSAPTPTEPVPPPDTSGPATGGSGAHLPDQYSCTDFTTQAEAQAVYDADRGDPHFLDDDNDTIACNGLLPGYWATGDDAFVDELRAATPDRAALLVVEPERARFGVFTEHAFVTEQGTAEFDSFVSAAGKHPDTVLVFQQWNLDGGFPRGLVIEAWRRGMLPIISWEPVVVDDGDQWAPELDEIRRGEYDDYLARWSQEAADLGLPFGLRFAHEMNGDWYPWSEEADGNEEGDYAATWRHVYQQLGASREQAIWIWSPNVVNSRPDIELGPLYPGDDVVDWVGTSGYYRRVTDQPGFAKTFGATIEQLREVTEDGKPILLSEVGADADDTGKKAEWMESLFLGLEDPEYHDVIGFVWFNMDKSDPEAGDPDDVHADWRIEQSPESAAAFRRGVATGPSAGRYGSGQPLE